LKTAVFFTRPSAAFARIFFTREKSKSKDSISREFRTFDFKERLSEFRRECGIENGMLTSRERYLNDWIGEICTLGRTGKSRLEKLFLDFVPAAYVAKNSPAHLFLKQ